MAASQLAQPSQCCRLQVLELSPTACTKQLGWKQVLGARHMNNVSLSLCRNNNRLACISDSYRLYLKALEYLTQRPPSLTRIEPPLLLIQQNTLRYLSPILLYVQSFTLVLYCMQTTHILYAKLPIRMYYQYTIKVHATPSYVAALLSCIIDTQ